MKPLDVWLAKLECRHPQEIDLGLGRCGLVFQRLGSPRPAKKLITVAGTNGKGSTLHYFAVMSSALGQRCGTYTSPHIVHFNERITIMGKPVSDQTLVDAFEQVERARGDVSLTYFEFTTLAAFLILQDSALDCAVLEVGLGGRLDAVNLLDTDCALITPIGLDHQDYLGPDIPSIALEKAGIIRAEIPVVCTQRQPPAPVLQTAENMHATVYCRGRDFDLYETDPKKIGLKKSGLKNTADDPFPLTFSMGGQTIQLPRPAMQGEHQISNLATALAAFVLMNPECLKHQKQIEQAISNCSVAGRLEKIQGSPTVLIDVGHNALAAAAVAHYFLERQQTNVICVLSMLRDKSVEAVALALNRVCNRWICVESPGSRGQSAQELGLRLGTVLTTADVRTADGMDAGLNQALNLAGTTGQVLVFGSFSAASSAFISFERAGRHFTADAARII